VRTIRPSILLTKNGDGDTGHTIPVHLPVLARVSGPTPKCATSTPIFVEGRRELLRNRTMSAIAILQQLSPRARMYRLRMR
jgi:hypothetical protein